MNNAEPQLPSSPPPHCRESLQNFNLISATMSGSQQKQTYTEWAKDKYNAQYESWMPWIEDNFLRYFTKDNKASHVTKQQLDKTKVSGVSQVDNLQDGVHNLVGGQVGQGGVLQPVGDLASREGVNRAERGGKDDKGGYLPKVPGFGR